MLTAGCGAVADCIAAVGVGSRLPSGLAANFPAAASARAKGSTAAGVAGSPATESLGRYEGSIKAKSVAGAEAWISLACFAGAAIGETGGAVATSVFAAGAGWGGGGLAGAALGGRFRAKPPSPART